MSTLVQLASAKDSSSGMHPLEPLTEQEVAQAVAILKEQGKVTPTTRFVSVSLKEPPKESVYTAPDWPLPREAFVVLFDNASNSCYEAALSLTDLKLLTYRHVPGAQPTMTIDEQVECEQAVLQSAEFKVALKKHYGIEDTSLVMVDIWSAGNYGSEEDRTKRLARPLCFLRSDPTDNGYVRPLEGLRPVVDLNTMSVIRVEEYGHWPLPPGQGNYAAARVTNQRRDVRPIDIAQPEGPSFEVEGYQVRWQNWNFVIGFSAREGLTLHHLRYNDHGN
ncbi:MAG: tyramine oxidase, partial [Planctomycetota bacterium]|nr:tyramine oxidase [Planctomycetota bacterium]